MMREYNVIYFYSIITYRTFIWGKKKKKKNIFS